MFDFETGEVILIDKPLDWTSFDTVNFIRSLVNRCYGIRKLKVGHAGTLDPLATGLLILCTGKMTKQIDTYQGQVKTYTGTILLGQTTPTFDLESEPDAFYPTDGITAEQIEAARQLFLGDLKQYPPKYSAIKIKGKRAFDYARSDEEIELKARDVRIDDFNILAFGVSWCVDHVVAMRGQLRPYQIAACADLKSSVYILLKMSFNCVVF